MIETSLFFILSLSAVLVQAEVYLRQNNMAYAPNQPKRLIVMSDSSLDGGQWVLVDQHQKVSLSGKLTTSIAKVTDHTAKPFNYLVDLSLVRKLGADQLLLGKKTLGVINIKANPYRSLSDEILRHLKVE